MFNFVCKHPVDKLFLCHIPYTDVHSLCTFVLIEKTEDGGQRTEVRGQRAEVRGQRAEDRRQGKGGGRVIPKA